MAAALCICRVVVQDVITQDFLLDPQAFTVTVQEGIVTLSGQPESDQVGHLLAAAARRVEGMASVRDQMRCTAGRTTAQALPLFRSPALGRAFLALGLAFR